MSLLAIVLFFAWAVACLVFAVEGWTVVQTARSLCRRELLDAATLIGGGGLLLGVPHYLVAIEGAPLGLLVFVPYAPFATALLRARIAPESHRWRDRDPVRATVVPVVVFAGVAAVLCLRLLERPVLESVWLIAVAFGGIALLFGVARVPSALYRIAEIDAALRVLYLALCVCAPPIAMALAVDPATGFALSWETLRTTLFSPLTPLVAFTAVAFTLTLVLRVRRMHVAEADPTFEEDPAPLDALRAWRERRRAARRPPRRRWQHW